MRDETRRLVSEYLDSCATMTLATSGKDGPWAASLFFARDDDLNLYFISSEDTRHVHDLSADFQVAVTVNMDYGDWRDIKGVQMAGRAAAVSNDDLPRVTELYLARFPDVRELLSAPDGRDDNAVSAKFAGSRFYVVRPLTVRYIDNTQGFGHREEFSVEEQ